MRIEWSRHRNLLVGFFAASATILFLTATGILLGRKGVFNLEFDIYAVFENGVGLRQGTDVQFNGVQIGRVERVSLVRPGEGRHIPGSVVLHMRIDKRYQGLITDHSRALALRDKNLVSDRVINIESARGTGNPLADGDTIEVANPRDIESVLTGITALMVKMDLLIGGFDSLLSMARSPSSSVGAMLGSRELYDNVMGRLGQVDTLLHQGNDFLDVARDLEKKVAEPLPRILESADSIARRLADVAKEAENLGKRSNEMAAQAQTSLERVDLLLSESSDRLSRAGDVVDAVSNFWFIRGRVEKPEGFPLLHNEVGP